MKRIILTILLSGFIACSETPEKTETANQPADTGQTQKEGTNTTADTEQTQKEETDTTANTEQIGQKLVLSEKDAAEAVRNIFCEVSVYIFYMRRIIICIYLCQYQILHKLKVVKS